MNAQRELFDPEETGPAVCTHCGAKRQPGQERAPCPVDHERAEGIHWTSRPLRCLNFPRPEHSEIGF